MKHYATTDDVPMAQRFAAEVARTWAMSELNIDAFDVVFVSPTSGSIASIYRHLDALDGQHSTFDTRDAIAGRVRTCDASQVYVAAGMTANETTRAVLHEARHIAQLRRRTGRVTELERNELERDATAYERSAYRRLMGG